MIKESKIAGALVTIFNKGYHINNGDVISSTGKVLKLRKDTRGYLTFSCRPYPRSVDQNNYRIPVHQLTGYQKYKDDIFGDDIAIRHLNGDKSNNTADNIAIGSQSDNMMDRSPKDRLEHSLKAAGKRRKFTDNTVNNIKQDRNNGMTYKDIMLKYNITSKSSLHYILNTEYQTSK